MGLLNQINSGLSKVEKFGKVFDDVEELKNENKLISQQVNGVKEQVITISSASMQAMKDSNQALVLGKVNENGLVGIKRELSADLKAVQSEVNAIRRTSKNALVKE